MSEQGDGEAVIQVRNLTKKYGEFTALDRLSMSLERGRILGFIGPNGAGKTTAIKILVGLARPTSGEASIAGADCVRDAKRIKRLVGYMPDTFGAYDNMRVQEYLDFFGAAFGVRRKHRQQRIDEVLELTGAAYMRDMYVQALSHGMKQRVGIARTLLHDPDVLILDEPANGLDPNARIEMRRILLQLAELGKTLIVTSHILPELSRICDTVGIITEGKLRAFGGLRHIMQQISQRRIMEMQLAEGADTEQAAGKLRKGLGQKEEGVEVTPSPAEGIVRFTTGQTDEQLSKLLQALVQAQVPVAQFREVPMDLEDAFLSVTGQEGERTTERRSS
jgi:ABC-2 type transport system ATP-binding protein